MCTQRIFSRITWWKNFDNRSTFAKVIIKHQVAYFFGTQCITQYWYRISVRLSRSVHLPVTCSYWTLLERMDLVELHWKFELAWLHYLIYLQCFMGEGQCWNFFSDLHRSYGCAWPQLGQQTPEPSDQCRNLQCFMGKGQCWNFFSDLHRSYGCAWPQLGQQTPEPSDQCRTCSWEATDVHNSYLFANGLAIASRYQHPNFTPTTRALFICTKILANYYQHLPQEIYFW